MHLVVVSELSLRPTGNDTQFLPPANEVWGKDMFLHVSVILFTGRGVSGTPRAGTRPGQVHPPAGTPPGRCNPLRQVHPPGRYTPLRQVPPFAGRSGRYTPPAMHAGIRSTSGRYASYWNAFLFQAIFKVCNIGNINGKFSEKILSIP